MRRALDRLTLLETFVRIADAGSISAAARDLGLSQPSASRQLAELEERMQAQLMRRTTHSLALTEAGRALLADARLMLEGWEHFEEKHAAQADHIRGRLKVVAPIALGQLHLARIAWQFQAEHPDLVLSWQLADHPIRFAETGCDCWVKIGPIPDETLISKPLGRVERMVVVSPPLCATGSSDQSPESGDNLPFVVLEPFEGGRIPLRHASGDTLVLQPPVRMATNNIFALKEAALMGLGAAVLPRWFIADELAQGRLVDVWPAWRAPQLTIQMAYMPSRFQPQRLRALLAWLESKVPEIDGIEAAV